MMKYVVFLAMILLVAALWATGAFADDSDTITELERQSVVVGMVMGVDMSAAHEGKAPLSPEQWVKFAQIFDTATVGCDTIKCVTDRIVKLRTGIMNKAKERRI